MKYIHSYKKIIAIILVIAITNGFIAPTVNAGGILVEDIVGNGLKAKDTIDNSVQTANSTLNNIKEYGLDVVAQTIATYAGQKMANAIFNKANGGADGEQQPSFIQSFSDYFTQINDTETSKFITQLKASGNPFANQIISGIRATNQSADDASSLNSFTFDKITGVSLDDYTRDATTAGWAGYIGIALPGNNPYSAQIIAKTKLAQNKADALEREKTQLTSSGFTPQGDCKLTYKDFQKKLDESNNVAQKTKNTDPTAITRATLKEKETNLTDAQSRLSAQTDLGASQTELEKITTEIKTLKSEISKLQNTIISKEALLYKEKSEINGLTDDTIGCIENIIKNPTALVTSAVNNAATYALDRAKSITGWGGVITGVLTSMISAFLKKGLSSLATDQAKRSKPVGGPEELVTINGESIPYNQAPNSIIDLSQLFVPAHKYTQLELNILNDTLGEFVGSPNITTVPKEDEVFRKQGLIDLTVSLDVCNPGPDIYWEDRLKRTAEAKFQETSESLANGELLNQLNLMVETAIGETSILVNDPSYNIPGSVIMTQSIDQFKDFEQLYKKTREKIQDRSIAVGTLNTMVTELKSSIEPIRIEHGLRDKRGVQMPEPVFTEYHWNLLSPSEKEAYYQWAMNMTQ